MNEEFEEIKQFLQNGNDCIDIKENPVNSAVLLSLIKAMPIIGDLIDSFGKITKLLTLDYFKSAALIFTDRR